MTTHDADKTPNLIDLHVGARIRVRRRSLSITQDQMAKDLGLTFQQVQKYERGANRVSASKLYEIARSLQTPVAYFFEGLHDPTIAGAEETAPDPRVHEFLMTHEGVELASLFPKVRRGPMRRRILEMVRTLVEEYDEQEPA